MKLQSACGPHTFSVAAISYSVVLTAARALCTRAESEAQGACSFPAVLSACRWRAVLLFCRFACMSGAASSSSDAKRQRLLGLADHGGQPLAAQQELLGIRGVTISNMTRILKSLHSHGQLADEALRSADQLKDVAQVMFETVRICKELELNDGSKFEWEFAEPSLLMSKLIETCPALADLYEKNIGEAPMQR